MSELKISDKLTQPEVKWYTMWLGEIGKQRNSRVFYDERSCQLLDELFALLGQLKPISENGARSLWLRAKRGTIDDFAAHYGSFESLDFFDSTAIL